MCILYTGMICWSTSTMIKPGILVYFVMWGKKPSEFGIPCLSENDNNLGQQHFFAAFSWLVIPPSSNTVTLSYKYVSLGWDSLILQMYGSYSWLVTRRLQHPETRGAPEPRSDGPKITSCHFPPSNSENSPSWNWWRCTENHLQSPTFQATVGSRLVSSSYGFNISNPWNTTRSKKS